MARKTVLPTTGGKVLPKLISSLIVVALLAIVIKHPSDAATWAKGFVSWLEGAVDGIATFFQRVAG